MTEFIEIFKPQFLKRSSYVLGFKLLEDVLNFVHGSRISTLFFHFVFQKSHEVWSDWSIDENISVESGVVITFEDFDVSNFWEVSERIGVVKKDFDIDLVFETFNDIDDIVDLVPDGDHIKELNKHSCGVADSVLDLIGKFFFEFGSE